jgi:hypothetical protein
MLVRRLYTPDNEVDSSVKAVCICDLCGKEMEFTLSDAGDRVTGLTCACGNGAQFPCSKGTLEEQRRHIAALWRRWKQLGI